MFYDAHRSNKELKMEQLFVTALPMRQCLFLGETVRRCPSGLPRTLSNLPRSQPHVVFPRRELKLRKRARNPQQWRHFVASDLNYERRRVEASPSMGTVEEKRGNDVFRPRILGDIPRSFGSVLRGGVLDDLLQTLRARYMERVTSEERSELTKDVVILYGKAVDEIRTCDELYYGSEPQQRVSDRDYDELMLHLLEIEKSYPQLVRENSPSQMVGQSRPQPIESHGSSEREKGASPSSAGSDNTTVAPRRAFSQTHHPVPMLSLGNAYSQSDLKSFSKKVDEANARICVELKIDGVALALHYENRKLVTAATRGNGRVGDDVTENIRAGLLGRGVLEGLPDTAPKSLVIVRGEVFISTDDFRKLQLQEEWKLSNARNAAAGAIKHKDSSEVRDRCVQFVAYECLVADDTMKEFESCWQTQGETLNGLGMWGFGSMPKHTFTVVETTEEAEEFAAVIEQSRGKLPFEADGVVLKIDDAKQRLLLGNTAKSPRGAIALKFTAKSVLTVINSVSMQVARTGVITPVAELEPAVIGGATIRRATLHNFDEVQRLGVCVGDEIVLVRGGDVIPKISRVNREGNVRIPIELPEKCPCCGEPVEVRKNAARNTTVLCSKSESCADQNLGRLCHFARRNAMDIGGIGKKTAAKLLDAGLIKAFADIFRLSMEELGQLEGFKEKSCQRLFNAIQEAKYNRTLEHIIIALGVPGIGTTGARELALKAGTLNGLRSITREELLGLPNTAEKSAADIEAFLQSDRMQSEIMQLEESGLQLKGVVVDDVADDDSEDMVLNQISGKLFAFTGTLENMKRTDAAKVVKKAGGTVADLSGKSDFLVCGENPGGKYHKAQRLGIQILSESDLQELLSGNNVQNTSEAEKAP